MLPKGLLKEYSRFLSWVLRGLDVAAILIAGLAAYFWKFGNFYPTPGYTGALCIAAVLTPIVFRFFSIYQSIRVQGVAQHFRNLFQAMFVLLMLLACLAFITKSGEYFSRSWYILWAGLSLTLLVVFRGSLLLFLRTMRARGWNERRVIILGVANLRDKLANSVQHAMWTGFKIVDLFDEHSPADIAAYVREHSIDEVWLAFPLSAENRIKDILHQLRHQTVTSRLVLDIFGLDLLNHSITNLAGIPVLNVRSTPMIGSNRVIKALEDRLLASLILLLISPVLLIIAIAVKFSSPGPVFYRQKRVSWNGKEFNMLKFRTMPVDAEAKSGPVWAKAGEQRATKIGAFLRKTSLDELPQFINVVFGDMSIVGPRPERLVFVEEFKEKIPGYMQKHLVKAGITGWAQVNGWRGNTSLEKRIEYDLFYIENWSLAFDLKIILLTLFQGFMNKNAY